MPRKSAIYKELETLGFGKFATAKGRAMSIDVEPPASAGVYVWVLDGKVFRVGQSGNVRARFKDLKRWLALPDDSPRQDRKARDELLERVGSQELVFFFKPPMKVWSDLTGMEHDGHRTEETILIRYFEPEWNRRPGAVRDG